MTHDTVHKFLFEFYCDELNDSLMLCSWWSRWPL